MSHRVNYLQYLIIEYKITKYTQNGRGLIVRIKVDVTDFLFRYISRSVANDSLFFSHFREKRSRRCQGLPCWSEKYFSAGLSRAKAYATAHRRKTEREKTIRESLANVLLRRSLVANMRSQDLTIRLRTSEATQVIAIELAAAAAEERATDLFFTFTLFYTCVHFAYLVYRSYILFLMSDYSTIYIYIYIYTR